MSDDTKTSENSNKTAPIAASQTGILTDPVETIICKECSATISVAGMEPFSSTNCPSCNAQVTVPVKLGNFLLIRLIGTGGMGGVYFARDEQLGRDVAIKVMLQSLGADPQFIETFRHEAQAVAKLNHANIAQIYSFGQEKGQPYIVMELVSGDRVDDLMERPGGLPKVQTLQIGLEIAQGLSAADEAGLVHGDIKPENILLDKKGNAKLVDFGLATVAHQNAGDGIWGTPYYIAPEKIRRQKLDARSDIYSLGATLYHMLTGQPPFDGETPVEVVKVRLDMPPPDPRERVPDLPPIVSEIILRMLAVERTERYPNYRSLISDLRKAVETCQATIGPTAPSLGGGKSIRIKKKGSDNNPSTSTAGDAAQAAGGASKKIVFHKAGGGANTTRLSTTGRITKLSTTSLIPELTEEEKAAKIAKQKASRRKAVAITLSIVSAIGLAAGGYGLMVYRAEKQAERKALHDRMVATKSIEDNTANMQSYVSRIETILAQALPIADDTRKIAGQMNLPAERIVINNPAAPPAQDTGEPPAENTEQPPADGSEQPPAQDGTEQPPAQNAEQPPAQDAEQPPDGDAEQPPAPDATEEAIKQKELLLANPDVKLIQNIFEYIDELKSILDSTKTQHLQALEHLAELAKATSLQAVIELQQKVDELHNLTSQAPDKAKNMVTNILKEKAKLDEVKRRFDVAENQRLAAEERERQRLADLEAAEQVRKAEERKAEDEKMQVQSAVMNVRGLIDENAFVDAYEQLRKRQGEFTSEGGKEAFRRELERHRYLAAMQENIIKGIQTLPFPWGYGSGATARDITGASRLGIRVQGSTETIPWKIIQPQQMVRIIDFYLAAREIGARQKIEIAFGAALYTDLFGDAENIRQKSRTFATRAMDLGLKSITFEEILESRWHNATQTSN